MYHRSGGCNYCCGNGQCFKMTEKMIRKRYEIAACRESESDELLCLWEASVRSSHHFLNETDIQYYKPLVRNQYFPAVSLYIIRNDEKKIAAFIGLSGELIEMLFVLPGEQGKGYGKCLLDFAVQEKQIEKVDVNEQNEQALQFYLKNGFDVQGRDATDYTGKPFPILHLAKLSPLITRLSVRFHIEDVQAVLYEIKYNESRRDELYRLIYNEDNTVAWQALWVCSHFPASGQKWLQGRQEELINEVLVCPHGGRRRILLQLIEKQSLSGETRVDFLDFCLDRMLSVQELPGVQSLCMKLAYKLCQPVPELLQEFKAILELADRGSLSAATKSVIRNILKKIK